MVDTRARDLQTFLTESAKVWFFVLFLFAGYYKMDPRVAFIQTYIDITLLSLILSFLLFFCHILKNSFIQKISRNFVKVAILYLSLTLCLFGSLLYSQSRIYGLDKALRFAFITGWAFFGAAFLVSDFSSLRKFCWAIAAISTVMALDAITNYPGVGRIGFVTALGSNYIALARAGGLGFLTTTIFLLLIEQKPLTKIFLYGVASLQLWAALTAGARGPVLSLTFSLFFFFVLSSKSFPFIRVERYVLRLGAMILCVFIILVIIGEGIFPTFVFRTRVLMTEVGASALTRFELYQEALELWARSPVWGSGVGQFSIAVTGEDVRLYPHNILLELGAETGLVGVFFFVVMVGIAFVKPLATLKSQMGLTKITTRYLLTTLSFTLMNAMVSGDLNDNRILFTYIALSTNFQYFTKK